MLDKVRVQNYQSLGDTTVELGKALTVIVGPNDEGKSAFFRAVRSAVEGQSGKDFIKRGHNVAKVTLYLEGRELVWEKGAQVNRYYLDGVLYDRVGKNIPPDLSEFLGLSSVEFDKNLKLNLNFADQEDPPFLISYPGGITPSHVAKVLGDLTNLSVLFKAVNEADSQRKRQESEAKVRSVDVQEIESRLLQFTDLDDREKELSSLEALLEEIPALYSSIEQRVSLKSEKERLRSSHSLILAEKDAIPPDVSVELGELEDMFSSYDRLKSLKLEKATLASTHQAIEDERATSDRELDEARDRLELITEELQMCPLCGGELNGPVGHEHADTVNT